MVLTRIVHLSYSLAKPPYTDPQKWLDRVAFETGVHRHLTEFGEQICIYNIDYAGEVVKNDVRYIFPGFKRWQLQFPLAFNRLVKSLAPEAVIVHGLIFPLQLIMLARTLGPEVVIACQHHAERPYRDARRYIKRLADRYTHAYFFAAREQGDAWITDGQISAASKVHEIMGTSSIFSPGDKATARKSLGISSERMFLWVGNLDSNKDPITAVRAFIDYSQRRSNDSLHLIYQGGDLEPQVRQMVAAHSNIHMVGRIVHADLGEWFNAANFILSSSHYEGSGIAVCEAMSCGCIPVLTGIPSFRMMTNNGQVGLLYEAGNHEQLTNCLYRTLEFNLEEESTAALQHFNKEMSFAANASKIMNAINRAR